AAAARPRSRWLGRCELDFARPLLGAEHKQLGMLLEQFERTCAFAEQLAGAQLLGRLIQLHLAAAAQLGYHLENTQHLFGHGWRAWWRWRGARPRTPRRTVDRFGYGRPGAPGALVLDIDELVVDGGSFLAGLAELADAAYAAAFFAQPDHQRREIGVGRHQHDDVRPLGDHQIDRIDRQRDVGAVLAG